MLRIAICDDKERDADGVRRIVEAWVAREQKDEAEYDVFDSPALLLESHNAERYDLLILDVLMPEQTGIELARTLRRHGDETMVIYVSATTEYAMDAFGIQAIGYVEKPVNEDLLTNLLDRAAAIYRNRPRRQIPIMSNDGPVKVELMDIVYVENSYRDVIYVLRNDSRVCFSRRAGTFEEMIEPLPEEPLFVQVHKSFFVNMRYIKKINDETLLLDNGTELPIARRRKNELKDKYMNYIFEEGGDA